MSSTASPADRRSARKPGPRRVNCLAIRAAPSASVSARLFGQGHRMRADAPALVLPARLPVDRDGPPGGQPDLRPGRDGGLAEREVK